MNDPDFPLPSPSLHLRLALFPLEMIVLITQTLVFRLRLALGPPLIAPPGSITLDQFPGILFRESHSNSRSSNIVLSLASVCDPFSSSLLLHRLSS